MSRNILMVVTNTEYFADNIHKTGLWFEEFAVPCIIFCDNGYHVQVASLLGGKVPLDPESENLIKDIKWHDAKKMLENTVKLEDVNYDSYDAIVFPGGHGPMFDIAKSELVGSAVSYFYQTSKLVAAICHGPAGLLTAKTDEGYVVSRKRLTCFTNDEEKYYKKDGLMPFSLEDALVERNAVFVKQPVGEVNVVIDGNLITAQNYQSSKAFAETIIKYFEK